MENALVELAIVQELKKRILKASKNSPEILDLTDLYDIGGFASFDARGIQYNPRELAFAMDAARLEALKARVTELQQSNGEMKAALTRLGNDLGDLMGKLSPEFSKDEERRLNQHQCYDMVYNLRQEVLRVVPPKRS